VPAETLPREIALALHPVLQKIVPLRPRLRNTDRLVRCLGISAVSSAMKTARPDPNKEYGGDRSWREPSHANHAGRWLSVRLLSDNLKN